MTALRVILIIIGIILILLMIPLKIEISYDESTSVSLGYMFLKFRIVPAPEKKKKQKKKKKPEPEKKEKKTAAKKNPVKDIIRKQGLDGFLELIRDITSLVCETLGKLAKGLVIRYFDLKLLVVGDDSADTAVKYGIVCSVIYPAIAALEANSKLKKHSEDIAAGFLAEKTVIEFSMRASIRPVLLIAVGLSALVKGVRTILKYK